MSSNESLEQKAAELFAANDFAAAEPLYLSMLDEEPDNPQLLLMAGLCRRGQGDGAGALELLSQAAQSAHADELCHYYLGESLLELRRPDEALQALSRSISLNPNHAPARALLGYIQLTNGQAEQAIESTRAALRANPENIVALSTLALALLRKGELDEAYKHAQAAVKLKPEAAAAQAALGQVFMAQGHTDFAQQCISNALVKHPQNPELHAVMASIRSSQGDHAGAIDHYARAASVGHGGSGLLIDMSQSLLAVGRMEDALQVLDNARQLSPDDARVDQILAQLKLESGDIDGAEELLARLDEQQAQTQLLRAQLAEKRGDRATARTLLGQLDLSGQPVLSDQAALLSARISLAEGNTDKAIQHLGPLAERPQPQPTASLMLSNLHVHNDALDLAAHTLTHLLANGAALPAGLRAHCHRLLTDIRDDQGQFEQAADHMGKSGQAPAPIMRQLVTGRDQVAKAAWLNSPRLDWAAPEDGLKAPVIVLGWPGSGRGPLIEALAVHSEVEILDEQFGRHRANALLMPGQFAQLQALSEEEIAEGRADYHMASADLQPGSVMVEAVWWENINLPSLARFFPGAKVIVTVAELPDLELMWRMSGFGDIRHMLELWEEEARLLAHLQTILPLEFIAVEREGLFARTAETLGKLCQALGIAFQDRMAEQFQGAAQHHRLRPSRHWQHYRQVLLSAN